MFSEILKVIPKLDGGDLSRMESTLNGRFKNVAKRFGKGLLAAIAGGGITALALTLVDKLLNPLKEVQESIEKSLEQSHDIATYAKQFDTSAGKLFKLSQFGTAAGIDKESLFFIMEKFQSAVANAKAHPEQPTSVKNFVGIQDTAESFFQFIQALQKLPKTQQLLVQQEVFGERQILRMSDFLNQDFGLTSKLLRAKPAEAYTPGLEKQAALSELDKGLQGRRNLEDSFNKGKVINSSMIMQRNAQATAELQRENDRISSYKSLATIELASTKIQTLIEQGLLQLGNVAVKATSLNDLVTRFSTSRVLRGIMKVTGKGGN